MTAKKEPGKGTVWEYTADRPVRLSALFGWQKVVKGDTVAAGSVYEAPMAGRQRFHPAAASARQEEGGVTRCPHR